MIISIYSTASACFTMLIGQKSITWHKVLSATTGDDVLPVMIRLSQPVIIYARSSYCILYCKPGLQLRVHKSACRKAICARFLIVEPKN